MGSTSVEGDSSGDSVPLPRTRSDLQKRSFLSNERTFALVFTAPVLAFAITMVAYPMAYSLWASFTDMNMMNMLSETYRFVAFQQYTRALSDPFLINSTLVTFRFTAESVVFSVLIGLGIALLLNEVFPGRGLLRAMALLPWAVPEYLTGTIYRFLFEPSAGFVNSVLLAVGLVTEPVRFITPETGVEALSMAYAWHLAPLGAFFLLAGLQTISPSLYRAGRIDGMGPLRRFWNITLPHIRYPLFITLILATMEAMRNLDIVLVMTMGGPGISTTTMTYLVYVATFGMSYPSYGSAISYILIPLMLAVTIAYFMLLARRWRIVQE